MEWLQVLIITAITIGCCWFFRRETKEQISEMNHQMKDFHGRLCTLEERYFQILQKYLEKK